MMSLRDSIINHFKKSEYDIVLSEFEKKALFFENDEKFYVSLH